MGKGIKPNPSRYVIDLREAWHPETVEVWGRLATDPEDCEAIRWLHQPYWKALPQTKIVAGSIYRTSISRRSGAHWQTLAPDVPRSAAQERSEQSRKTAPQEN